MRPSNGATPTPEIAPEAHTPAPPASPQVFNSTGGVVGEWPAAACFPGGAPWGVRIDAARGRVLVADGLLGTVYVLALPPPAPTLGPCKLLQNVTVGVALVPHELALDAASGDLYLVGVGAPPTVQRYTLA